MKTHLNKSLITKSLAALFIVLIILCIQSGHALALEDSSQNGIEDLYNTAVFELLKLINAERENVYVPALKLDETMQKAANRRAYELLSKYSHDRPDGSNFSTVFAEFNLSPHESAENIGWKNIEFDVAAFHKAFMGSRGHRLNMLNREYSIIGIGFSNEDDKYYIVELFADTP